MSVTQEGLLSMIQYKLNLAVLSSIMLLCIIMTSSNVMARKLAKHNIALLYFTTLMLAIKCYGSQVRQS